MTEPMNKPAALLAELNHLRRLYSEALACVRRTRKWVRVAEEMAPREAAQMLDGLGNAMQSAYAKHLTGDHDGALAILRKDDTAEEDEESDDDAPDSE